MIAAVFFVPIVPARSDEKPPVEQKPLDASFLRLYAETRGFMLGRPVKPKPTPDGKAVLFLRSEAKKPQLSLFEFEVATGKTRELLTPATLLKGVEEKLSPEEKARRERMRITAGGFTDYQLSEDGKLILLNLSGKLYVYHRDTASISELATSKGTLLDPQFSPDGSMVAYVLDHDVYLNVLETTKEMRITQKGTAIKTHGLAEFVAQEEMGRFHGYWWSPDSKFIAYEEADHEGVETWYVADPAKPQQKPLEQYYPRPGKKNVAVRLGIVPVSGGDTVWVDWDVKKYEYLAAVRWDKTGPLTIQVQDRKQQELLLLLVEPKTGKTTRLVRDRDAAFLNLWKNVPIWLPANRGFLWVSEKDGPAPMEWRESDGKLEYNTFFTGGLELAEIVGVNDAANRVIFRTYANPSRRIVDVKHLKRRPEGVVVTLIGSNLDISDVTCTPDHSHVVATHSSLSEMPRVSIIKTGSTVDAEPNEVGQLPSIAVEPNFTPNTLIKLLGDESTKPFEASGYFTAIIHPRNFDPTKKYPVIVDVYGGPKHLTVTQQMKPWLLMQWLADQGFIIVAVDNRGTPGRGRDWERAIYQKFDSVPLEDQIKGLKLLGEKHPEMDMDRVGIVGWSFGGYMSALAVLKRPDIFKAAVAGCRLPTGKITTRTTPNDI